ncbi:unnamed protein product [Symbiodinium pilosum]|uniref:Uncharacterized protein n=1 Tax=Symbiodinium pilosum TaxID=2952 RepID=A0A812LJX6_SYMPI|nr:unnamed protein product [Symbiodinium pilosum]
MKEMVLTKYSEKLAPHESPRKRRRRSCKAKKTSAEKSHPEGHDQVSSIKPRKLDFEDESDGDQHEDDSSPASAPCSPGAHKSDAADFCDSTPAKSAIPSVDEDLFSGKFARPKQSPSQTSSPSARKKAATATASKEGKAPKLATGALDVPARTDEQREEDLPRKDEVRQLLDKIRENRLVAILPLDCKPSDQKFFLQILVQEDLLTVKDAFDNLGTYHGVLSAINV